MTFRKSDQPIVLRDGKAVHMGKGLTGIRNPDRKHLLNLPVQRISANLNWEIASLVAEASVPEEPGAKILHAGICAGGGWVTTLPTATAYVN
jgi:hypothetical protein